MKTLSNLLKQDKERYKVPRKVQDVIPIKRIWKDGIFLVGNKFHQDLEVHGHQLSGGQPGG